MNEPIIPIMSDVPIANQFEIYAVVMWVAERRNIPFHKAFILCMDHFHLPRPTRARIAQTNLGDVSGE